MEAAFKPTDEEVIWNSKPNYLYNHEFDEGRFFQTVHEEEDTLTLQIAAKTMLKVVFLKEKNDLEGLEIIKVVHGAETQKIKLSKFNLVQIKAFLSLLCQLDLGSISERRIEISDKENHSVDEGFINQFKKILHESNCIGCVENWLNEGLFTAKDIVNTGYRKQQLSIFRRMLDDKAYRKEIAQQLDVKGNQEEKIWQAFFEKNPWIFGYGLDYHYREIIQREYQGGAAEGDGSEAVIADYLMADTRFCAFVELKTPDTELFKGNKTQRSKTWALSTPLMDAISQILQQKASSELRIESQRDQVVKQNGERSYLNQHAYDPKIFLIIGDWKEIKDLNSPEQDTMKRTLELYRRNLRNVDILTYDELYDRAKFIAEGSIACEEKQPSVAKFTIDDLPF